MDRLSARVRAGEVAEHAPPDHLRLGRQYELETILGLACGIVEQHILRPRSDINSEDRMIQRG